MRYNDSLPEDNPEKKGSSYYDLNVPAEGRYRDLDKYLGVTNRFGRIGILKKFLAGTLVLLFAMFMFGVAAYNIFGLGVGSLRWVALLLLVPEFYAVYYYANWLKRINIPPVDLLSLKNIIEHDGIEAVYTDFENAEDFGKESRIGRQYMFIQNKTVIRINDIRKIDSIIINLNTAGHSAGEGIYPAFGVLVNDELGEREYPVARLKVHSDKSDEFKKLKDMINERYDTIMPLEIDDRKGYWPWD